MLTLTRAQSSLAIVAAAAAASAVVVVVVDRLCVSSRLCSRSRARARHLFARAKAQNQTRARRVAAAAAAAAVCRRVSCARARTRLQDERSRRVYLISRATHVSGDESGDGDSRALRDFCRRRRRRRRRRSLRTRLRLRSLVVFVLRVHAANMRTRARFGGCATAEIERRRQNKSADGRRPPPPSPSTANIVERRFVFSMLLFERERARSTRRRDAKAPSSRPQPSLNAAVAATPVADRTIRNEAAAATATEVRAPPTLSALHSGLDRFARARRLQLVFLHFWRAARPSPS